MGEGRAMPDRDIAADRGECMRGLILGLLRKIGEDPEREGLVKTPARVERTLRFLTSGYHQDAKEVLNGAFYTEPYDEMILVKDIDLFSLCEHHMLPFFGKCHVAYLPDKKVVGISKIARLVEMYSRRLQIQERMTSQIAEAIVQHLQPFGVAVVIEARHLCMIMRGVQKQDSMAITRAMLGKFREDARMRMEFMSLIGHNGRVP
jgi:GTP cyclohydrolase I